MSPNPGAVSPRLRAQFSALPVRRSSHEFGLVCRLRGQLRGQTSAVHRTKDTTNDPIHHHELATASAQKIPSPRTPIVILTVTSDTPSFTNTQSVAPVGGSVHRNQIFAFF